MDEKVENCPQEAINQEFKSPPTNFRQNTPRFKGKNARFNNRNQQKNIDPHEEHDQKKPFVNKLEHNIKQLSFSNTLELPPLDQLEKKFSNRNRIYISNISSDTTEEELQELLKPYGETAETFINSNKNFAFVKMDFHANAVKACMALDNTLLKQKNVRLKLSPCPNVIKVKNLMPSITSELLHYAFSPFGEVESAKVLVDERGKSTGEGIVDFVRKNSAIMAVQKCKEKCYYLSYSLRPVVVEPYEVVDQSIGLLDRHFNKRNTAFVQERSEGPRLSETDTFEHDYGCRWISLFELYKQKEEALRVEFRLECDKLSAQMEFARYEQETEQLRVQLRTRELDKERQQRQWEAREKHVEEEKSRAQALIRQSQEQIQRSLNRQSDEMRRRQEEADLLRQAQNLTSILDSQECEATSSTREISLGVTHESFPNKGYRDSLLGVHPNGGQFNNSWNREEKGHWVREECGERGYQAKRRRF